MQAPTLVAMTDTAGLQAAGIGYPTTLDGWRWLYRHRDERGYADAFRRIGHRIIVDVPRFIELTRSAAPPNR